MRDYIEILNSCNNLLQDNRKCEIMEEVNELIEKNMLGDWDIRNIIHSLFKKG